MRPTPLAIAALALPFLAFAQNTQNNTQPQPSQAVIISTSVTTIATLDSNRQASTTTSSFVFTTTQILTPAPQPSGNGTVSGNSTVSANSTTTTSNLPTAPTNISGGGGAAPSPGGANVGGIYGPDDNYIAAATALKRNAFVVGFVGFALGGAMLVL
ncbi:hypothetical protein D9756_003788 [Leucocoprinus leucothites]|uniref:Uncharacterized protein n=1 Tax=Leucocoprinus leucothites TaxID=201217 RepID=A0A8H5G0S5_9AGAR|nr:hypothetical protein D9756_003788 [Leucoagaricus leucothites]